MIQFLVLDIETSGEAPPAEVMEIAVCDARLETSGAFAVGEPVTRLFKPLRPVSPAARAVHHISPQMVEYATPVSADDMRMAVAVGGESPVLVAHNSAFERLWLTDDAIGARPWICSYKAALRVFPDAPGFGNQALRYWLEDEGVLPRLDQKKCAPAHRAGPDTYVTTYLLGALLQRATVEEMVAWTKEPRLMPRITFGKHKGCAWSEPPYDYLRWIVEKSDMDDDTKWNAARELTARQRRSH